MEEYVNRGYAHLGENYRDLTMICGFARSGTTWLSKILDSCPDTYLVSEPDKKINQNLKFGKLPHCLDPNNTTYRRHYKAAVDELMEFLDYNTRSFPFFEKNFLSIPFPCYYTIVFLFKLFNVLSVKALNKSVKSSLFVKKGKPVKLVWKSVNQSSNLEFLANVFPEMKIIYIFRNPFASLGIRNKK